MTSFPWLHRKICSYVAIPGGAGEWRFVQGLILCTKIIITPIYEANTIINLIFTQAPVRRAFAEMLQLIRRAANCGVCLRQLRRNTAVSKAGFYGVTFCTTHHAITSMPRAKPLFSQCELTCVVTLQYSPNLTELTNCQLPIVFVGYGINLIGNLVLAE